ncbi:efflux RND transporter periplasmic adaptor subunit [Duganella dendranthematis]|uniref:Efflux RND transporter periplasmic adaptor subunit n=1 Tax=Duganella dendranthematis TaxID=2728021 RepID=A0ABX6MF19_9BURK|nr:efflux RND transporter periplasmic adaptor subunit [Duganella dendranthematis]QJD92640.1 efflux RND transporter periplasmic adaptor subunit [Duganella dendranthematis]
MMKKATLLKLSLSTLLVAAALRLYATHASEAPPPADVPSLVHEGDLLRIPELSPLRRSLTVAAIDEQSIAAPFTLPALVEADPARLVKVTPPLAGRIVSLNKQLGDEVKAGEVLFTIDAPDMAQAGADNAKAQSALLLAQRNLARQRELAQSDIAAKRDVEQAQGDYDSAAAEAARATARLAQLGAHAASGADLAADGHAGRSSGRAATAGTGRIVVRSPIAGRVVELSAAAGAFWNDATAPLMTVADLSKVFISANAQEKDLPQLYIGQQANIKLDAWPQPVAGQVRYIGEMLDADTRTIKVRLPFDNRDGHLKPGMFAEATLLARPHNGMLVPMTAVIQSGFASRAFVEVKPWQFEARELKLGTQIGEQVEVLDGLKSGERIVTKDGVLLND